MGAGPQCGGLVGLWSPIFATFICYDIRALHIVNFSFINCICHYEYIVDTHDSSICGSIFLVIQLINDLCQQQYVVLSCSKRS